MMLYWNHTLKSRQPISLIHTCHQSRLCHVSKVCTSFTWIHRYSVKIMVKSFLWSVCCIKLFCPSVCKVKQVSKQLGQLWGEGGAENWTCSEKNNDRPQFWSQCVNRIDITWGCIFLKRASISDKKMDSVCKGLKTIHWRAKQGELHTYIHTYTHIHTDAHTHTQARPGRYSWKTHHDSEVSHWSILIISDHRGCDWWFVVHSKGWEWLRW